MTYISNPTNSLIIRFHFECAAEAYQQEGPLMAARMAAHATWHDYESDLDDAERVELQRELNMRVHEARLAQISCEFGEASEDDRRDVAERLIEEILDAPRLTGSDRIDLLSHLEWLIAGVIGEERARAFMEDHGVPNLRAAVTPMVTREDIEKEIGETLSTVGEADTLEKIQNILVAVVTNRTLLPGDKSALLTALESKVHAHNMALLREEGEVISIEEIEDAQAWGGEWVNSFIEWAQQQGHRKAEKAAAKAAAKQGQQRAA